MSNVIFGRTPIVEAEFMERRNVETGYKGAGIFVGWDAKNGVLVMVDVYDLGSRVAGKPGEGLWEQNFLARAIGVSIRDSLSKSISRNKGDYEVVDGALLELPENLDKSQGMGLVEDSGSRASIAVVLVKGGRVTIGSIGDIRVSAVGGTGQIRSLTLDAVANGAAGAVGGDFTDGHRELLQSYSNQDRSLRTGEPTSAYFATTVGPVCRSFFSVSPTVNLIQMGFMFTAEQKAASLVVTTGGVNELVFPNEVARMAIAKGTNSLNRAHSILDRAADLKRGAVAVIGLNQLS